MCNDVCTGYHPMLGRHLYNAEELYVHWRTRRHRAVHLLQGGRRWQVRWAPFTTMCDSWVVHLPALWKYFWHNHAKVTGEEDSSCNSWQHDRISANDALSIRKCGVYDKFNRTMTHQPPLRGWQLWTFHARVIEGDQRHSHDIGCYITHITHINREQLHSIQCGAREVGLRRTWEEMETPWARILDAQHTSSKDMLVDRIVGSGAYKLQVTWPSVITCMTYAT